MALLALATTVVLVGCSGGPSSGTVLKRDHTAAYYTNDLECMAYNTNGTCRMYIPVSHYHPDEWQLLIRGGGKQGTDWVDVTQDEYNQATPGARWSQDRGIAQ